MDIDSTIRKLRSETYVVAHFVYLREKIERQGPHHKGGDNFIRHTFKFEELGEAKICSILLGVVQLI